MASEGPNNPGTLADDATVGTVAWTNPGNAAASDASSATATLVSQTSHYLKATNFGFSLPVGANISGVTIEIRWASISSNVMQDSSLKLVVGGSITGTDKADGRFLPTGYAYTTYGGAGDLWGAALTASDVNASTFGVVISVREAFGLSSQANIDHVRITVYYTTTKPFRRALLGVGF